MDLFCEQLVKYKKNTMDKISTICMYMATFVLAFLVFFLLLGIIGPILTIALTALVIYLGYKLVSGSNKEFEYIVTNTDLDIDKIIAGRKRKRIVTTNIKNFTAFGKYKATTPKFNGTIINASENILESMYYAEFTDKSHGNVRLIFSPNEKVLKHIKPFVAKLHPEY